MVGCLKMYMDCTGSGRTKPKDRYRFCILSLRENCRNTGSWSCNACPHLFMHRRLFCTSLPLSLKEPSSKKKEMLLADFRKYSFVVFSCTTRIVRSCFNKCCVQQQQGAQRSLTANTWPSCWITACEGGSAQRCSAHVCAHNACTWRRVPAQKSRCKAWKSVACTPDLLWKRR